MKKLTTSVSPFLMMIIPVVILVGLSLTLKSNSAGEGEFSSSASVNKSEVLMNIGKQSLVRFLLK